MSPVFLFYVYRSLLNRIRSRLRRLRRPRYLISLIAGLGYVYAFFLQPVFVGGRRGFRPGPAEGFDLEYLPVAEVGFSFVILGVVLLPWLFPYKGNGVLFTEAEIQFLFPAPLSRRSLLHLRLLKGQIPILFGVLVSSALILVGRPGAHFLYVAAALWIIYSFLGLYRLGTSLTHLSLGMHGISGLKRQAGAIALAALATGSVVLWLVWFIPSPPRLTGSNPTVVLEWVLAVADSGPARYLLLPFRWLVRPALATTVLEFLSTLPPALTMLALAYLWVVRSDVAFEEAALERAEEIARRLDARREGASRSPSYGIGRLQRPPFDLSPRGLPFVAIFWKNLTAAGRSGRRRVLPFVLVACCVLAVLIVSGWRRSDVFVLGGSMAAGFALITTVLGPLILRDDLRTDLLHVEQIKTYPVGGRAIVLGEVLAPTIILTVIQWGLVLIAAVLVPSGAHPLLSPFPRTMMTLAAIILLPCLSLFGILIQNAAVLLLPGWAHLGREHQQGVEAIGQRLLTTAANLLLLVVAVVPGGVLFTATAVLGFWLLGMAVIPVAALVAASGLLAEAALVIVWMGILFDRLDLTSDLQPG